MHLHGVNDYYHEDMENDDIPSLYILLQRPLEQYFSMKLPHAQICHLILSQVGATLSSLEWGRFGPV